MIGWWLLLTFVSSIIQFLHGRTIGQVARKSMGRIVGGHSTTIDRNPWQVQLVVYGYTFKCGGSLLQTKKSRVQSDIVLTAAHCMGNQPHEYSVIVGSDQKLQGEQIPVKDFKTHEKYHSTEHMIHDIALIKLVRPVRFSSLVQGIQLPQKGQPTPPYPEHCKSTGFGLTKEGGQASQDLLEVRLPYLGKETCGNKFAWSNKYMVKGLAFCAGLEQGGYSTCQGDSGGPFVCVQQNNKFRQYGVVSWGYGCGAAGSPAAFTNLAKYKTWIRYTARSIKPHEYSVIVGSDQKLQGEQIPVKDFKSHEKFHSTEHAIHDIALIKLVRPVRFSSLVQGIQLPERGQPTPPYPDYCKSTGFGATKEGGQDSQDLLEVVLPYLSKETCGNKFTWFKYMVKGLAFCAGFEQGGYDACQGDSGGPFVCLQQNNKFRQYGVVSWGYGCGAAGSPGAYTNLAKYKTWIRNTARSM